MPKSVENCVVSTMPSLRKRYPKWSDERVRSTAYAICQKQHKRKEEVFWYRSQVKVFSTLKEAMAGSDVDSNLYSTMEAMRILESQDTLLESLKKIDEEESQTEALAPVVPDHFFVRGIAISEGTTRNGNTYLAEELRSAASTLVGCPLQLDHGLRTTDNIGKVVVSSYDPSAKLINYIARIRSDHQIASAVRLGDIDSVSIGATVKDVTCGICDDSKMRGKCRHVVGRRYEDGVATQIGHGLRFVELSLTPFPADPVASMGVTITHASYVDALTAFTESWRTQTGDTQKLSENQEGLNSEVQSMLDKAEQSNLALTARLAKTIATKVADAEVELGHRKAADKDKRVTELSAKPLDALEFLSESFSSLLIAKRSADASAPLSKGIVAVKDKPSPRKETLTKEQAKEFIRRRLGFPEPSESARRVVREWIRDPLHPQFGIRHERFLRRNE